MDVPWKSLPDLPDLSGLSRLDLPDLPDLTALGSLAAQLQTIISWAIAHPFGTIALVLLAITLIQIVADLIKRSLKALLTLLLKLPLFVSQWIWRRTIGQAKLSTSAQTNVQTNAQILSKAEQADQLIARLEALRQEQDQIVAELKSLLLNQPTAPPASLPADSASPSPPSPGPLSEAQTPSS